MHYTDKTQLPCSFKEAILNSKVLMLQKEIPMEINVLAAELAKKEKKIVVLDCGGRNDPLPSCLLENVDILSPNRSELERIIGERRDEEDEE